MEKGKIHLYTGNGKGKTTAALGLALRAAGNKLKVYIAQFVKGMHYGELDIIADRIPEIELHQFGRDCFINREPEKEDIEAARKGLEITAEAIISGKYDVYILDEVCIALYYKLFNLDELIQVLNSRKISCEVILTGRYAPPELYNLADLVTEMKEIKHYYNNGLSARKGIEF
jgi:cob(I)alamin adenosyltransferase